MIPDYEIIFNCTISRERKKEPLSYSCSTVGGPDSCWNGRKPKRSTEKMVATSVVLKQRICISHAHDGNRCEPNLINNIVRKIRGEVTITITMRKLSYYQSYW